jgi:hypothetical protein
LTAWYHLPAEEMGPEISNITSGLKTDQSGRRNNWIRNLELFEGRKLGGYSAHSYVGEVHDEEVYKSDRDGLIRSAVATAVSNFYAPQKPKPQFQTLGATWAIRRKAYRLDRICEGILNQRQGRFINVWSFAVDAVTDTALQGDCCIKVVADRVKRRIVHELVPGPDLFYDPAQGRYPTDLFQRGPIDEEEALHRWPGAKVAINSAQPYEWYGRAAQKRPRSSKVIEIQYAWHLPDGPDKAGKWAVVINGKTVDSGDWTAPAFPFVFIQWEPHRDGPWASGIGDEMRLSAEEAGELDHRLMLREILASGKKGFYKRGTVKPEDLEGNDPVTWVAVDGDVYPQENPSMAFHPMDLDYLKYKIQVAWDRVGISQMSAAARREPNITSGIAQMTLNDTKSGRQLVKSQRYEQAFVDLAHQYVWRLRELAEDDKDFAVKWSGRRILREQKWDEADIEDDMFSIQVAPTAALPHDPAGRQQMIQSMFESSLISQETAKLLIGWPDIDSELQMENAESEYIDTLIERYLDAEPDNWGAYDYQAPEGFLTNKVRALTRFAAAWFRAKIDQMALPPEEQQKAEFNLALLVRYIRELDKLMRPPEEPAPAEAARAPGAEGMPPGGPAVGGPAPDQLPPGPMGAASPEALPPNPAQPGMAA